MDRRFVRYVGKAELQACLSVSGRKTVIASGLSPNPSMSCTAKKQSMTEATGVFRPA